MFYRRRRLRRRRRSLFFPIRFLPTRRRNRKGFRTKAPRCLTAANGGTDIVFEHSHFSENVFRGPTVKMRLSICNCYY